MESLLSTDSRMLASSMYHSAFGTLLDDEREMTGSPLSQTSSFDRLRRLSSRSLDTERQSEQSPLDNLSHVRTDWEEHQQRAETKKLSAQLSINEALLTISSLGRKITEISVPGVKVEFLKRPYDSATRLLVQDLCIVDRIQTFGPEYELVVCSSGRSLLGFSPLDASLSPSSSSAPIESLERRNQSCPNFASLRLANSDKPPSERASAFRVEFSDTENSSGKTLESISPDLFNMHTKEEMSGALCALTYIQVSPLSPQHPAMKELEEQDVCLEKLEDEPNIHRINLQCTAIDAIGA